MARARRLPAPERKRRIIESARAVFAGSNYSKAGTAELAKAAGVSEPALYRHFGSKKELFLATLRASRPKLLELWERIAGEVEDPLETLWNIGVQYYDHLRSRVDVMKLNFQALSEVDDEDIQVALRENFGAYVRFFVETLDEGKARGIVREDLDSEVAAWHFLGMGLTLDLVHLLGFEADVDRTKVECWGRLFLESVRERQREGPKREYVLPGSMPWREPPGEVYVQAES
jgi:AcrR family transcriptional regulator